MKKMRFYWKDHKLDIALVQLLKLLEAGAELLIPLCIANIIDRGIPSGEAGRIFGMGFILLSLGLARLLCTAAAQYFAAKATAGFAAKLRDSSFRRMQTRSWADLRRIGSPTLTERLTHDIDQIQSGAQLLLVNLARSPFVVFGTLAIALHIDPRSTPIFAITIPASLSIALGLARLTLPLRRRARIQRDEMALRARENLTGARVLRAFHREDDEIDGFNRLHAKRTRAQSVISRIDALQKSMLCVPFFLALVALLRIDAITQGNRIALMLYTYLIFAESLQLADLIAALEPFFASIGALRAMRKLRPSPRSPINPTSPSPENAGRVDFEHVTVKHPGSAELLHNISFSARRGQIIGVVGGTGAGKTTLVDLIPRLQDTTSGIVRVGGVDVRKQDLHSLRARIGIVPQHVTLLCGSIRDNLRWGNPDASDEILLEAVRTAQAWDILEAMGGLDGEIETLGQNLTASQRQRLAIARALVRKPEILILDDSAPALDLAADARLRMALRRLPHRPTVFIVSRRADAVRYADRILVLDDGRIAGDGTHEWLLEHCRIYQGICNSQPKKEMSA